MAMTDDQLREAIERDPRSRYAISHECGVDQGVISRLMNGRTVTTETADRLAECLGFEIVLRRCRKETKRG